MWPNGLEFSTLGFKREVLDQVITVLTYHRGDLSISIRPGVS